MNLKKEYLSLTGDTEDLQILHHDENFAELALIFPNVNSILIPKKLETNLRKYVSKELLKTIDTDINLAVEKCFVLVSNLASTYYTDDRWKRLNSEILHQQTKNKSNTFIYKKIIELLKTGTSTGTMLEVDERYSKGRESKKYKIPDSYFKPGLTEYFIKDSGIIQTRNKTYYKLINEAHENPICNNLLKMYQKIELPASKELLTVGKQLVKDGYTTKKSKILTVRNKHDNSYWANADHRSFVEDNIELFQFLTNRGFMIPTAGNEKNGGRVVDSFTLMPAWIRNEITVDTKKLIECDYRALHPNLAMYLYQGKYEYLTHEKIAEETGIDLKLIKTEHLSFFNKNWYGMMESPLFDYYAINEPDMLNRIYQDKKEHGHKITSKKMFKLEVEIMTDVIKYLNSAGIYILYVYDALLCEEKDKTVVMETMNRIILKHGIKTCVKDISAKIAVECAIKEKIVVDSDEVEVCGAETIAKNNDPKRMTVAEYFKRFKIKFGSYIIESSLDYHYDILLEYYTYIDEIPEEHKTKCIVETYIDGEYGSQNIFK